MPRFVLLDHDHPTPHLDLMLEANSELLTWRLEVTPERGGVYAALHLPNHRKAYLDYEGPVSGNRGRVAQRDQGVFTWVSTQEHAHQVRLEGRVLRGVATLTQARNTLWELRWTPDE
ncbi:MAG: DNA polymerase ligase N-terminal domain-containing protein [Gemmataceae bacterium]